MKYLLDSNTISDIYNPSSVNHNQVINKLVALTIDDEIYVSVLTLYEFEYAFANSPENKKPTIKKTLEQIQQDFTCLPLTAYGAQLFGELKKLFKASQAMSQENIKKNSIDFIIAASALENNAILVSADKIYQSIYTSNTQLIIENWTR